MQSLTIHISSLTNKFLYTANGLKGKHPQVWDFFSGLCTCRRAPRTQFSKIHSEVQLCSLRNLQARALAYPNRK